MPVAVVGRESKVFPYFSADSRPAVAEATGFLLDAGHAEVLYLGAAIHLPSAYARLRGFEDAFRARGMSLNPNYVLADHGGICRNPRQALRDFIESGQRFTALVAASDFTALGAIK
ncbi:substrate-binding domain-containing protein, partial [Arthrospira platensis SPKY1]|nr:substrate-binding domain-containing protein [Arthrospira platensis SPKY1]